LRRLFESGPAPASDPYQANANEAHLVQTRPASPTLKESACACLVPPALFRLINHQLSVDRQFRGCSLHYISKAAACGIQCTARRLAILVADVCREQAGEQPGSASTPAPSTQHQHLVSSTQHSSSIQHHRQRQLAPLFRPTCHHLVSSPCYTHAHAGSTEPRSGRLDWIPCSGACTWKATG
jgi:hypothetical protein